MPDEYKYSPEDLVASAIAEKPLEFETAFAAVMTDRLARVVDDRKVEVAQGLATTDEDEEPSGAEEE